MLGGEKSLEKAAIITRTEIAAMGACACVVLAMGVHLPAGFVQMIHRAMAVLAS
jgi:hypothetical protein